MVYASSAASTDAVPFFITLPLPSRIAWSWHGLGKPLQPITTPGMSHRSPHRRPRFGVISLLAILHLEETPNTRLCH